MIRHFCDVCDTHQPEGSKSLNPLILMAPTEREFRKHICMECQDAVLKLLEQLAADDSNARRDEKAASLEPSLEPLEGSAEWLREQYRTGQWNGPSGY